MMLRKIITAKPKTIIPKVSNKIKNEYVSDATYGKSIQSPNEG